MGNQEIVINRKKQNFRTKKRIFKKAMRNQGNNQPQVIHTTDKPLTEKKQRREAKKQEIKQQKKLTKQQKKEQHMDVEPEDSD